MTGIIDIHSHILPGLDDGSSDMRESIHMLRLAAKQGITQVVATPHYSHSFQNTSPDQIRRLCREVQETARRQMNTEILIWPGQEIMYDGDMLNLLAKRSILTIADSRYVLTEFLPSAPYSYIYSAMREISLEGYIPILAHAERYIYLCEKDRVDEIKSQGACIQVNFRRIGGKWYDSTTRWCREMLRSQRIDFLGTDMHNIKERRPETGAALEWMKKHLDREYLSKILYRNQQKVLADEKI